VATTFDSGGLRRKRGAPQEAESARFIFQKIVRFFSRLFSGSGERAVVKTDRRKKFTDDRAAAAAGKGTAAPAAQVVLQLFPAVSFDDGALAGRKQVANNLDPHWCRGLTGR